MLRFTRLTVVGYTTVNATAQFSGTSHAIADTTDAQIDSHSDGRAVSRVSSNSRPSP